MEEFKKDTHKTMLFFLPTFPTHMAKQIAFANLPGQKLPFELDNRAWLPGTELPDPPSNKQ